jgi:hypothetical protein
MKQLIKQRIQELVSAYKEYMNLQYGCASAVNEQREFDRIYAEYQLGRTTLEDIDEGIADYRSCISELSV